VRIGIITFHRAINYGAILQAYALHESIKALGHQAVIIDYKNPHIEKQYDPISSIDYRNMKSLVTAILLYHRRVKKIKYFDDFRTKYFLLDQINDLYGAHNTDNLEKYDGFLTGSDQVWNYATTRFDKAYFLDFVSNSKKKSSYAASFGFDRIPDEYLDEYKTLLGDFNHLSVREEQGAEIIKNLINRRAEVVLDPTMLLSRDEWIKVSQHCTQKNDYILIYQLAASQSLLDFASDLSKRTNCEIVCISDALRKRIKATYARGIGPQQFLGLFRNAKYIVTNSFHGSAFSIIFNKPFFVEMLPPPAKINSRLENILDTFYLRSRQIIEGRNSNILEDIEYTNVNKKLEQERQHSLNFLKRILED